MDIVRVRYFLAVCEQGSFTAAAKACGVSQPSVTTGVRRLERAIGGCLFERRHPVRLTPLGEELRPLLEGLQSAADRITDAVERVRGGQVTHAFRESVLGRGAKTSDRPGSRRTWDERLDAAAPIAVPGGPLSPSDRWMDLLHRSREAIERSEFAIQESEKTWQRLRGRATDASPPVEEGGADPHDASPP